jgi:hypothetical protein
VVDHPAAAGGVRHRYAGRRILALWSAPRCRSTAFFRMMVERGDFVAVHEPFSTLAERGAVDLPGGRVTSAEDVVATLRELSARHPVFLKDTTDERYPALLADPTFLGHDVCSTFLVRHPAATIPSYYAINPRVRVDQIGFGHLYEIFALVRRRAGEEPVVIDSDDLVRAPARTVQRYCREVSIPYVSGALRWSAGQRPEWRATERWHVDVSNTTGFERRAPVHDVRAADVANMRDYLDCQVPYYERLRRHRLLID